MSYPYYHQDPFGSMSSQVAQSSLPAEKATYGYKRRLGRRRFAQIRRVYLAENPT
ncbi:hypothetical protein ACFQUU_16740 [Herbaspirillum sp. GCM10030257]|uniref:hypothetical protein n=1 Tax=Herbaspirillum sp. GCM10030257 TaxID=3273393 RepID=UPI00360BA1FA